MIDTHAHLEMLDDGAVARAREAGVTRILTIGTDQALALADAHEDVYAVVGIHPHEAGQEHDLDRLRELLARP